MKQYDVIVIGAGAAGLGSSGVANFLKLRTLLIEKDAEHFGGDCTNYGCVPSKALIHIASHFHHAREAARFGLKPEGKADMKKVLEYIHSKQEIIKASEDAEALRKKGIDVVIGEARFASKNVITANGESYTAKIIFLCTGSRPENVEIEGMSALPVYTNESVFFDCDTLPDNLLVIGGGPIGCELGQAFSRLGSKVTLVNRGGRLLKKEQETDSRILQERFEAEGISVLNNATVTKFSENKAHIQAKDRPNETVLCDAVLVAAGRKVITAGLDLDKAGIALDNKGKIRVNEYLQSTNKKVYVLGDAAGTYQFSHGAEKMVRQVWRNLLIPVFRKKNTLDDLSWVTFTDPQVAHFGLTEAQLTDAGTPFIRQDQGMEEDDRAIIQEYGYGHVSIWLESAKKTGNKKLLAGSMTAPLAGEIIQEYQFAKHAGVPIGKFGDKVYPYPVSARINQKTVRGLLEKTYTDFKLKMARAAFDLFN